MKLEDRILTSIFHEYKETYKTWINLKDRLTPTGDALRENIWMLRAEFYKRKSEVLLKFLPNELKGVSNNEQKEKVCNYEPSNPTEYCKHGCMHCVHFHI